MSKTDKRAIAEAVSSFANSEGGTLIYGVRTQRNGGADVAAELVPISDIRAFETNFRTVCALNISPHVPNVEVRSVELEGTNRGYLVCEVGRSDNRPHMSTAPGVHSYFRRSFEGNVPMTPSEVRDQILAVRDAILQPIIRMAGIGNLTNHGDHMSMAPTTMVLLKNTGRTLCKNPFLRLRTLPKGKTYIDLYDSVLDAFKTDFPYGTLIPVGDELRCINLQWSAIIDFIELRRLFNECAFDFGSAVILLPHADPIQLITVGDKISLESLLFEVSHGAENAAVVTERQKLSRADVARSLLGDATVRDMYTNTTGPWQADAIEAFRNASPNIWNWLPEPLQPDGE